MSESLPETSPEPFVRSLDALGVWRVTLDGRLRDLVRFLREQGLLDETAKDLLDSLRQRLAEEKLVVAFVAEFSRGKSELINAIFFSDAKRRIMPASPGRTTMCPVELGWDPDEPVGLALLPIETRLEGASLAELRSQPRVWVHAPVDVNDPEAFAKALTAVMDTRPATIAEAVALGFWSEEHPRDNPPIDSEGRVEVPLWRHVLINVPHPLLQRGLVVFDTPGLNAIGAEPELTVGLLPSAHVVVFVLGADTGVTRSDLEMWQDHLAAQALTRYVVLNKIDTLLDPLSPPEHTEAQIAVQCAQVAKTLDMPSSRVYPVSARQALEARVEGNPKLLGESRLPSFEEALAQQILPQRRAVYEQLALEALGRIERQTSHHLGDLRRQVTDQLVELRGLRGKNVHKVAVMLERVQQEATEFENCTRQLQALRGVHARMLKGVLAGIAGDALRRKVDTTIRTIRDSLLKLGARKQFAQLFLELRMLLEDAQRGSQDIRDLIAASFTRLNSEFGFSLVPATTPDLSSHRDDLALIERNYTQYLGVTQGLRLSQARFMEQFRRMLLSRLRVVFEGAANEIEVWNRSASDQIDVQLRERRRAFKRRRESLERIALASQELESRLAELEANDQRLSDIEHRLSDLFEDARRIATSRDFLSSGHGSALDLELPTSPMAEADPDTQAAKAQSPVAAAPVDEPAASA
jgi:hypothetical protein